MIPKEVLLSAEIINLPSMVVYPYLTLDQQKYFLSTKLFWTEIYAALTRFQIGQPIALESWDKNTKETVLAYVDLYVSLYKYISFGWSELLQQPNLEGLSETPGKLFLQLLQNRAVAQMMPCLEGYSFSPQVAYRTRMAWIKGGRHSPNVTSGQIAVTRPERVIDAFLSQSANRQVQKARREYIVASAEIMRLQQKAANPARKEIQGGQWIDGVWHPSQKGVRHHPNPPDE